MKKLKPINIIAIVIIALVFFLSSFSQAGDVTKAPEFLPGFPMRYENEVMLMWTPIPNAIRYEIYLGGKKIAEAPAPPFNVPLPMKKGVYSYSIAGVDKIGNTGPVSKEGILPITVIEAIPDFKHDFIGDLLTFTWRREYNAVSYDIYRSWSEMAPYELIASNVTDNTYIDFDVDRGKAAGKTFYYKIIPKDKLEHKMPDTGIHMVKIRRYYSKLAPPPELALRILKTKQVGFVKPHNSEKIRSLFDVKFFKDNETMVYTDPMSEVIAIVDKNGKRLRTLGEKGIRPSQFGAPYKLCVDEDDNIYVTDRIKQRFYAYTKEGYLMYSAHAHIAKEKEITYDHENKEPFNTVNPGGILAYKDNLYITDKVSGTIQIYNKSDGEFIKYFREKKNKNFIKYFLKPVDLLLDKESNKLYVSCPAAKIIEVVDIKKRETLYDIGRAKTLVGAFMNISGLGFDNDNNLLVTDDAMNTIQVFSKKDGKYMYHIGDKKAKPDKAKRGQRPKVFIKNPGFSNADSYGKLWVYLSGKKGFTVRKKISNKIWRSDIHEPEL